MSTEQINKDEKDQSSKKENLEELKKNKLELVNQIAKSEDSNTLNELTEKIDSITDVTPKEVMVELIKSGHAGLVMEKFSDRPDFPSNEVAADFIANNDVESLIKSIGLLPQINTEWVVSQAINSGGDRIEYLLNRSNELNPEAKKKIYESVIDSGNINPILERLGNPKMNLSGIDSKNIVYKVLEGDVSGSDMGVRLKEVFLNPNIGFTNEEVYQLVKDSKIENSSKSFIIQSIGKYDEWIDKKAA